jgi:hypothetical protein
MTDDLTVPRPVRVVAFGPGGSVVKEFALTGADVMAPRQLAHSLLHADAIVRVQIFDLTTDVLLLEREEPSDVVDP